MPALRQLPRGTILHWEFSHFVVLDRATRQGIQVVDPARGRCVIREDELRRAYTGVAILLEPGPEFVAGGTRDPGTWRYVRPILGQARGLGTVLVTSLILRVTALAIPLTTALVIDELVPRDDRHLLGVLAIGVLLVIGYQLLGAFLRGNQLLELRTRLDMGLTMGFVDHLVELPYSFFLRRSAGDLMMRMQSNTSVRDILTSGSLSAAPRRRLRQPLPDPAADRQPSAGHAGARARAGADPRAHRLVAAEPAADVGQPAGPGPFAELRLRAAGRHRDAQGSRRRAPGRGALGHAVPQAGQHRPGSRPADRGGGLGHEHADRRGAARWSCWPGPCRSWTGR